MKLKHKVKTIVAIDYNDLDRFLQQHYGFKNYEFVAVEEMSNDSDKEFTGITGTFKHNYQPEKTIAEWKAGKCPGWTTNTLLEMLVRDGHLPAGDILVSVSW